MLDLGRLIRTARRLDAIRRKAPHIEIKQFGQLTPRPQVSVSVVSRGGSTTIDSFPDNDQGNAQATLRASSFEHVLGLPVADCRQAETNEADAASTLTRTWRRLPGDCARLAPAA